MCTTAAAASTTKLGAGQAISISASAGAQRRSQCVSTQGLTAELQTGKQGQGWHNIVHKLPPLTLQYVFLDPLTGRQSTTSFSLTQMAYWSVTACKRLYNIYPHVTMVMITMVTPGCAAISAVWVVADTRVQPEQAMARSTSFQIPAQRDATQDVYWACSRLGARLRAAHPLTLLHRP